MTDATNPEQPTPPPAPPYAGASYPPPAAPAPYSPPAYPTSDHGQSAAGYGQPPAGYGQPAGYGAAYGYGPVAPTNALSIISLVAAITGLTFFPFIGSIVGIVTGHMSLKQLRTSGEKGRGMALAGTIIGYVSLGLVVLGVILFFTWFALVAGTMSTNPTIGS
ncbi:DUF4190 domain-containing protein [Microbacterium sp. 179-B 1A2 NHS]|uniref:DUF4190 domain-containing protein n=1 Tax=Microbacterium sp. 179-B 1A2 NHS TaxID=3142383 RepID=UPI0039A3E0FF